MEKIRSFLYEHSESIIAIVGAAIWLAIFAAPMAQWTEKCIPMPTFIPMNPNPEELIIGLKWIAKVFIGWILGEGMIAVLYPVFYILIQKDLYSTDRIKVIAIGIASTLPWIVWISIF